MKLHIVPPERYPEIRPMIAPESCGAIYPLSVLLGIQSGTVFADDSMQAVLIWHCCGFGFLFGAYDHAFLEAVAEIMQNPVQYPRLLLFAPDEDTVTFFRKKDGFLPEQRLFFRYPDGQTPPESNAASVITSDILPNIHGRITPDFSWTSSSDFLRSGRGFCVMQENVPAAWAFSAAVSDTEIDIGVETDEQFRRRGFAFAAAAAMCRDILSQGKMPVWACHAENTGSQKLAAALGFVHCGQCLTIRRISHE